MNLKSGYTAQELADLQLSSIPHTRVGVSKRAKKQNWQSRPRTARGGGLEYAFDSLPKDVQTEIKARHMRDLIDVGTELAHKSTQVPSAQRDVMLLNRNLDEISNKGRKSADARMLMALLVLSYEVDMGRTRAIGYVSQLSRKGELPIIDGTDYNTVCRVALARHNSKAVGVGTRKLHQWVIDADKCTDGEQRLALLSPQKQGRPNLSLDKLDWLGYFMAVYRNPNGISFSRAYETFAGNYAQVRGLDAVPSINQVRLVFNRLPKPMRERGRVTGSRLKQLSSYIKRDWNTEWFLANDVWVGDGHAMKMKVKHPIHGHEFMPEITLIMDASSRYIVGWSLGLSESHLAVADALRHAMTNNGVPAIYYSDNGSGQTNDIMDNPLTGMLPRIGVTHATGIAGNPQGRGIIERAMKEVPNRVAARFATYFGAGADKDTTRKMLYAVKSGSDALVAGKDPQALTALQKKGQKMLPTWQEVLDVIAEEVYRYNYHHVHRSIKTTPAKMREALIAKMTDDGMAITPLSEMEARDMFRPTFTRRVQRGRVYYKDMGYGDEALEALDGSDVLVGIDIHSPQSVQVRDMDGVFICEAQMDYRTADAFPLSYVEEARQKRQQGIIKRAENKIRVARAEDRKVLEHEANELLHELATAQVIEAKCRQINNDDDDLVLYEHQARAV